MLSFGNRWFAQSMYSLKNAIELISTEHNFSKLKRDLAGMSDDPFYQPRFQTFQRPVSDLFGQVCAL
jgi:hypothetical protein